MKRSLPRLVATYVFTLLALAIVIPTVKFDFRGQHYQLRNLNPEDFDKSFLIQEFAFSPALDLQGGDVTIINVDVSRDLPENRAKSLNKVRDIVLTRLRLVGLGDFEVSTLENAETGEYKLVLKYPQPIAPELLDILIGRGEVSFWTEDVTASEEEKQNAYFDFFAGRKQENIDNSDLLGARVVSDSRIIVSGVETPANFGLKVKFLPAAKLKFASALYESPTGQPILVAIDSTPMGVQAGGQLFNSLDPGDELLLYTFSDDTRLYNAVYAAVISTPVLDYALEIEDTFALAPTLGSDTLPRLTLALPLGFAVSLAAICFYFRRFEKWLIMLNVINALWLVALLKIFGITLSMPMLLGAIATLVLFMLMSVMLLQKVRTEKLQPEELENYYLDVRNKYRNMIVVALVLALALNIWSTLEFAQLADGIGFGLIAGLLAFIIAVRAHLPFLSETKK